MCRDSQSYELDFCNQRRSRPGHWWKSRNNTPWSNPTREIMKNTSPVSESLTLNESYFRVDMSSSKTQTHRSKICEEFVHGEGRSCSLTSQFSSSLPCDSWIILTVLTFLRLVCQRSSNPALLQIQSMKGGRSRPKYLEIVRTSVLIQFPEHLEVTAGETGMCSQNCRNWSSLE